MTTSFSQFLLGWPSLGFIREEGGKGSKRRERKSKRRENRLGRGNGS